MALHNYSNHLPIQWYLFYAMLRIILFKNFFSNDTANDGDHIDLWNGNTCKSNEYFKEGCEEIWFIKIPPA